METTIETKEERLAKAKVMYEMSKKMGLDLALPAIQKLIAQIESEE